MTTKTGEIYYRANVICILRRQIEFGVNRRNNRERCKLLGTAAALLCSRKTVLIIIRYIIVSTIVLKIKIPIIRYASIY